MNRRVLFVDDQEMVLRAFERNLRLHFEMETAVGPVAGLAAIAERGPFAAVLSDLRMPEMDGIEFLSEVKKRSPDTVRLMMSGNADLQAAIGAVNNGNIFRFLTKPCKVDGLRDALDEALKHYQLVVSERELLEDTLNGSVGMMAEILSVVRPLAFSRASRMRGHIRDIAARLGVPNMWEFDLASMLSQIGCIAVPSDILEKVYAGEALTEEERQTFASHPSVGQKLLAKIPRMGVIAEIVGYQMTPFHELRDLQISKVVKLGAHMLMVARRIDETVSRGDSLGSALRFMNEHPEIYDPSVTIGVGSSLANPEMETRTIRLPELQPGMIIDEDLVASNGLLLVAKGQEVSEPVIAMLENFSRFTWLDKPFSVRVSVSLAAC